MDNPFMMKESWWPHDDKLAHYFGFTLAAIVLNALLKFPFLTAAILVICGWGIELIQLYVYRWWQKNEPDITTITGKLYILKMKSGKPIEPWHIMLLRTVVGIGKISSADLGYDILGIHTGLLLSVTLLK
jgi:hypothetical protein